MGTEKTSTGRHLHGGMKLLYEDRDLLVVDKPSGLLTMGTERDKTRTAYCLATDYVRKGNPKARQRLFIVHRLDRDTSGVLLLAKTEAAKTVLQGQWDATEKRYLAIVQGHLPQKKGTISTYLTENSAHNVYSTPDPQKGKLSHTAYQVLQESREFSLVEIDLLTGRKNQIRVHFAEIGHPVVGDSKYGGGKRTEDGGQCQVTNDQSFSRAGTGRPLRTRRLLDSPPPGKWPGLASVMAERPPVASWWRPVSEAADHWLAAPASRLCRPVHRPGC
jgi:RluA family pseudouridine synthase